MSISMYSRGETFKLAFFPSSIGHKLMHQRLLQKTHLVHKLLNVQKKKRSKNGKICSDFRDQPTGSLEGNPKSTYSHTDTKYRLYTHSYAARMPDLPLPC